MRIGIFTDSYPPYINGVSTSIVMLEKELRKMGHQVYIITVNDKGHKYKYEKNVIRIPGIPVGIYDYRFTSIYPIRIINKIKKMNLDVIHSQTEFGVGTFARIIARQFNIPIVHTYHTAYEDYVHYITHGHFNKPSKKIVQYITKFYCDKTVTELIVPTKKIYNFFKEKYKYDRNIHVIPTGIDTEKFYKEKFKKEEIIELKKKIGLKNDDFVILFVGRIGKEKSIDLLIDEQKDIVKKYPKAKLVIIGAGPDEELCHEQIKKNKLENNVIMVGKVPLEDMPKYYQLGNVFVTASRTETQGLTVIEAMAASLPVVAANDESFQDIVIDDLNGYLFNNKKEYRKIIEDLIKDEDKLVYLSRQARMSSENFSSKIFAQRILEVYKSVVIPNASNGSFLSIAKNVFKNGFRGK